MTCRFLYKCRKCGETKRSSGAGGNGLNHLIDAISGNRLHDPGNQVHQCAVGIGIADLIGTQPEETAAHP